MLSIIGSFFNNQSTLVLTPPLFQLCETKGIGVCVLHTKCFSSQIPMYRAMSYSFFDGGLEGLVQLIKHGMLHTISLDYVFSLLERFKRNMTNKWSLQDAFVVSHVVKKSRIACNYICTNPSSLSFC
jgi:hypothetical protein